MGEENVIEMGLEKHEVVWARWDIVNHGKDSKFIFNRKLLENYKQQSDINFTFKKMLC